MASKAPYILLLVLFIILVFIVGVRYGQRIEKTNKAISYVLKISPTTVPTEVPAKTKNYKNQACEIDLVYPGNLKLKEATPSGKPPILKLSPR